MFMKIRVGAVRVGYCERDRCDNLLKYVLGTTLDELDLEMGIPTSSFETSLCYSPIFLPNNIGTMVGLGETSLRALVGSQC